jgi:hypothetical protein
VERWQHIAASVALGAVVLAFEPYGGVDSPAVLFWVLSGIFIDLDHFVAARLRYGDWRHLRRTARDLGSFLLDYRNSLDDQNTESYHDNIASVYAAHLTSSLLVLIPAYVLYPAAGLMAGLFFSLHISMDLVGLARIRYLGYGH